MFILKQTQEAIPKGSTHSCYVNAWESVWERPTQTYLPGYCWEEALDQAGVRAEVGQSWRGCL